MDSTLPVAVPPPYKSQRGWLIAFGVVEILMGCASLLMILFMAFVFFGPTAARMPPGAMATGPMSPRVLMLFAGLQYGLVAAVFITAGIGSIRCKNWARIMMLVVSGLWLGFGLLTALMMAFMFPIIMRQQSVSVPPGIQHTIIGVVIGFTFVLGILAARHLLVLLFSQEREGDLPRAEGGSGRAAGGRNFCSRTPDSTGDPGSLASPGRFHRTHNSVHAGGHCVGVILHGAAAVLIFLTYSVLSGCAAWYIFRRKLIGWQIALFNAIFWTISMVVTDLRRPDLLQLYRDMGLNEQALRIYEQFPQFLSVLWVGMILMMSVLLIFLLYTRKFFPTEARA